MAELLRLAVLGKPQLEYKGQPLTADLISAKGQALLIYLAVTQQAHSRSALAGLLWGDMPEETARANLRLTLTKLRKILPDYFEATRQEIRFQSERPYRLDVIQFEKLTKAPTSIHDYKFAAGLYRGDFLADFIVPHAPEFDNWVAGQRQRLQHMAVDNLRNLVALSLQDNDMEGGIVAARMLLTIEPWHEEAHRHLMRLLAHSGQRSAALAQYETCRRLLAEELGVEPTAETIALLEQIKTGEQESERTAEKLVSPFTPHPAPLALPHNLPVQLTPFIGRSAELTNLVAKLRQSGYRLITLIGEGGMGKTRLALTAVSQLTHHYADGLWFVPLAGVAGSEDAAQVENQVATAVATALNLTFVSAQAPKIQLINYLRHRHCLLLLDNFEHLLAGAGFVLDLLTAAPHVTVLATSREPLHFQAEYLLRLDGLTLPDSDDLAQAMACDSVQLFAERAERSSGRSLLTPANLPDIIQICRFVHGSPLGLELAAASTRYLSPAAIFQALQNQFDSLQTSLRDVTPRHRSLQAVFDYSWQLLTTAEQTALAQLAVFRRGFQLEAAQAVAAAAPPTIFTLMDKSLVQHHGDGYYGLHELLRQFAMPKLVEWELDYAALQNRHTAYYMAVAGQQEAALLGAQPQVALRRLQADAENLAAAWQWAATRPLLPELIQGMGGMTNYWTMMGLFAEGEALLATAVTHLIPLPHSAERSYLLARLPAERGSLLYDLNRLDEMAQISQTAIPLCQAIGDKSLEAHNRLRLGQVLWRRGDLEAAGEQFEQAQALIQAEEQPVLTAVLWRNLAAVAWRLGDLALAQDYCHRSLLWHQQAGDVRGEMRTRHFGGMLAANQRQYAEAQQAFEAVLQAARDVSDRRVQATVVGELGLIASYEGRADVALAYFEQEKRLVQEMGVQWQVGSNLSNTGDLRLRVGDFAGARVCYEAALAIFRQPGMEQAQSNVMAFMGLLAGMEGRFADGRSLCQQALQLAQQTNAHREQAYTHLFMAHNLMGLKRWAEAHQHYTLAQQGWQLLGDVSKELEARAGLAMCAWLLGDGVAALTAVNATLTHLKDHTLDGVVDPLRVYLVCYEVLAGLGDERAAVVLANGRAFLQNRADLIQDPVLRQSLLNNVPANHKFRLLGK